MRVELKQGTYVLAVSGGVDSMVLLDVLARQPELEIIVAHYDHGIRPDSMNDRLLVQETAERLSLAFVYESGHLGPRASEALARQRRYGFLHDVRHRYKAAAVITAHHQDDLLETMLLNMLRGTGRRGLSSLRSGGEVLRPLLGTPKADIVAYAQTHGIRWREDSTNHDMRYRRNQVRHIVMPRLTSTIRGQLLSYGEQARRLNDEIDKSLAEMLDQQPSNQLLNRRWFTSLPHAVAAEVLAAWLRQHGTAFDRPGIERLVIFSKTAAPGKCADVDKTYLLVAGRDNITLVGRSVH